MKFTIVKEVVQVIKEEQEVTLIEYIGLKIKYYREKTGMNFTELAQKSKGEISSSHLSRLESGQSVSSPSLSTICTVADALGVHFQDLLPQKEEKSVVTENNQTV